MNTKICGVQKEFDTYIKAVLVRVIRNILRELSNGNEHRLEKVYLEDQKKITLLANHINNTKRDSLNGHSPFELSQLLLDKHLLSAMKYKFIAPDDVMLTPELI